MASTSETGMRPSQGEAKGMEMEPEMAMPLSPAARTQSAKPATLSSGVMFRFFRLCCRLADTLSFTFLQPQAAARWTPRRLGISARSSTPGTAPTARYTSSVSAIWGTALGCMKDPTSITENPATMSPRSSATFSWVGSRVFSF